MHHRSPSFGSYWQTRPPSWNKILRSSSNHMRSTKDSLVLHRTQPSGWDRIFYPSSGMMRLSSDLLILACTRWGSYDGVQQQIRILIYPQSSPLDRPGSQCTKLNTKRSIHRLYCTPTCVSPILREDMARVAKPHSLLYRFFFVWVFAPFHPKKGKIA